VIKAVVDAGHPVHCRSSSGNLRPRCRAASRQYAMGGGMVSPESNRCCDHCGVPTRNPRYCTRSCAQEAARATRRAEIRAVQGRGIAHRSLRKYLLDEHGHECSICGSKRWNGEPIPLVLDHVDGDAENGQLDNLRLVCPNCDAQLPTFKGRNRGRGRAVRRERYRAGLSY
jgi:hypothetical protein